MHPQRNGDGGVKMEFSNSEKDLEKYIKLSKRIFSLQDPCPMCFGGYLSQRGASSVCPI